MQINMRTLTPVHIGTGEELAPLDYVIHDGILYRLQQKQLFEFIQQHIPEGPAKFKDWISEIYTKMNQTRDNRELSQLEKGMSALAFCQSLGKEQRKDQALLGYLRDPNNSVIRAPLIWDKEAQQLIDQKRQIRSVGRVREAVKNGNNHPIIPGSSIKGAIRTAVFYHFLTQNHQDSQIIESIVQHQLADRRVSKERFALPLAHLAFFCHTKELHSGKVKKDDELMDLFKLVKVSDAKVQGEQPLNYAKVNIYLVEKKQVERDRSKSYFEATQQRQTTYCETIVPDRSVRFDLDFDIDFLLRLKPLLGKEGVMMNGKLQWIGVETKVKQLFGLDLNTLQESNREEKKAAVLEHLWSCLQIFNDQQLHAFRQWLDHFSKNEGRDRYSEAIEAGAAPVFQRQTKPMLHLGYATGFDGMTALLYFLADERRKKLFQQVMERFNLGNKPGNRGRYLPNPDRFPKSKRLVDTGRSIQPMGWLELLREGEEIAPLQEPVAESSTSGKSPAEETPAIVQPEYFSGALNYKKPPDLDAVVIRSGSPNIVKVYFAQDNSPEMKLDGYRNPIESGKVLIVRTGFNKKGELLQVSFKGFK